MSPLHPPPIHHHHPWIINNHRDLKLETIKFPYKKNKKNKILICAQRVKSLIHFLQNLKK